MRPRRWLAMGILALVLPAAGRAQDPVVMPLPDTAVDGAKGEKVPRPSPRFASAFLRPGHWALGAVRRLYGLGLVGEGHDRSTRAPTLREVAVAFERAVRETAGGRADLAALVRAYRDRFAEEYGATVAAVAGEADGGFRMGDGAAMVGVELGRGRVLPGVGYENGSDWTGPVALDDEVAATGAATWGGQFFPLLAATVAPAWDGGDWTVGHGYATVVWRSVGVWLGRRDIGYAPGAGGGLVLNGESAFDGGGIFLADPVRLPGVLRHIGPLRLETFLSRVDGLEPVDRPWFWGARLTLDPHERVEIGVTRAAMFGGAEDSGLSLRNLAYLIIGKHAGSASEFDNQILAVDLWYRLPLGSLPLSVYLQWGIEDSAGAWRDTPGVVVGLEIAALPYLTLVAVGLERASFSESCCGNPIWYRHWRFAGGWTDGGVPLGHPLGGDGSEWLFWADAALADARVRIGTELYVRRRGEENLFSPDREGSSTGGAVRAELRLMQRVDVILRGMRETGDRGWAESSAFAGARIFF